MNTKNKNLLRTGSWQRAFLFYVFVLLFATFTVPTLMYVIVTFFTTFNPERAVQLSLSQILAFMQNKPEASSFMLMVYAMVSLFYWSLYFNALIRARMLRNRDGRPEVAGNYEYGSSTFIEIDELAERYTEVIPDREVSNKVSLKLLKFDTEGK